ncbi:hypothetical protein [Kocuria sp. KH4]
MMPEPIEIPELGGDVVRIPGNTTESLTVTVQVPASLDKDTWDLLFPGMPRPEQPRYRLAPKTQDGAEPIFYEGIFVPVEGGVEFREDPVPTDREPVVLYIAYPPTTTDEES